MYNKISVYYGNLNESIWNPQQFDIESTPGTDMVGLLTLPSWMQQIQGLYWICTSPLHQTIIPLHVPEGSPWTVSAISSNHISVSYTGTWYGTIGRAVITYSDFISKVGNSITITASNPRT